jgi:hypothetical protein
MAPLLGWPGASVSASSNSSMSGRLTGRARRRGQAAPLRAPVDLGVASSGRSSASRGVAGFAPAGSAALEASNRWTGSEKPDGLVCGLPLIVAPLTHTAMPSGGFDIYGALFLFLHYITSLFEAARLAQHMGRAWQHLCKSHNSHPRLHAHHSPIAGCTLPAGRAPRNIGAVTSFWSRRES